MIVSEPPPTVPLPKSSLWQRRVVRPIMVQLTQGITPEKIALTIAVGSACAFFPILGTTALLCILVGIVLKLNQPLIQLINALCSVPHLVSVYALIRLGDRIFGVRRPRFSVGEFLTRWPHTFPDLWAIVLNVWRDHGIYLHRFGATVLHALVAWAIIAPFWIFIIHRLVYPLLRRAALKRGPFHLPAPAETPPDVDSVP